MYNWTNSEAILYNGIFVMCSCVVSVTFYFLFGLTKLGEFDKRKMILTGLIMFIVYLLIDYPWFFYDGPLTFIPENTTTREVGGCERSYDWCASTVRVPMIPYLISFFINGIGFPFICAPGASLFSLILGPRRQQRYSSYWYKLYFEVFRMLYEVSGYKYVILVQLIVAFAATLSVVLFYKQLQPLQMKPKLGKSASYKNGIFYVL
ncbi:hypothetical protein WR25_26551 [Diploscapter pachys]|uniref:Uncharacterized protein n=1 Tax=Diploscapter pachys TaxID=2018661 RepID=A0A2A2LIG7_9BILA|nr:hypothetical protein WR25_26551 [Diploscapter pachys]